MGKNFFELSNGILHLTIASDASEITVKSPSGSWHSNHLVHFTYARAVSFNPISESQIEMQRGDNEISLIIGDEAFADCELLEIEIPGTVRKVGTDVIKNTAPDIRAKAEKEKEEKRYADACEAEFQRLIVEGFKFGKYHYYENATNAPIDWIPVAHVENKFLFVSKYIICANTFHNSEKCTGWAVSTLRNWLNDSFSTAYFNQEEKSKILLAKELTAMISGADDLSFDDKVFVLSKKELKKFNLGVCYKTPYCAT